MNKIEMENIGEYITQDVTRGITIIFVCCILVIAAALIDMWTGVDAARVNRERIRSHSLREQRPEWGVVGLLGKILVHQDGTLAAGGFCMPNSEGIATTADSGYYVLEVKNGTQARVLVR